MHSLCLQLFSNVNSHFLVPTAVQSYTFGSCDCLTMIIKGIEEIIKVENTVKAEQNEVLTEMKKSVNVTIYRLLLCPGLDSNQHVLANAAT